MGKLYWFLNVNGEENLSGAVKVYKKILDERENVVLLSANEIRQAHRDIFDEGDSDEAWKQSANRDMRLIRYLTEQDIDVVYCSCCEFQETKDWVVENIREVECISDCVPATKDVKLPFREAGSMYWITGLSGAGKTTVGTIFYKMLRKKKRNVILMDGDAFRDSMESKRDYSREARRKLCYRNAPMIRLLSLKGLDIVNCTIAMFEDVRQWNKDTFEKYVEIYLETSVDVLRVRKPELYEGAIKGEIKDVVGIDQKAEFPQNPDIKIFNDGTKNPEIIAAEIYRKVVVN